MLNAVETNDGQLGSFPFVVNAEESAHVVALCFEKIESARSIREGGGKKKAAFASGLSQLSR